MFGGHDIDLRGDIISGVAHTDVYLNGYAAMDELLIGLTKYFAFYNA